MVLGDLVASGKEDLFQHAEGASLRSSLVTHCVIERNLKGNVKMDTDSLEYRTKRCGGEREETARIC